jgi:hypothetical protein
LIEFICKHHKIIEDFELEKFLINSVCDEANVDINRNEMDENKMKGLSQILHEGKVNEKNLQINITSDPLMKTFLINIMSKFFNTITSTFLLFSYSHF